eukprot:1159196-Pelagomonas_calceolata.AAC.1
MCSPQTCKQRSLLVSLAGATSPIAQALCTSLYRHGATVVLGCRGPSSRGEELATTLHTAALQQQQRQRCAAPSNSSSPASNGHAQQELATGSSHKAGGTPGSASDMSTASQADNILANTTVGANHKGAAALEAGVTAAAESTPQKAANAITGAQSEGGAGTTFIPSGEGGGSGRAETQDSMGRLLHVPCDFSCLDGAKACADAYEVSRGCQRACADAYEVRRGCQRACADAYEVSRGCQSLMKLCTRSCEH